MSRIDAFLAAVEEERYEIDLARRRRPALGELYARNGDLFSLSRIAGVQRELAGLTGTEERRTRALLEFLARGHAVSQAAETLDQRLAWEIFGSVVVGEDRIPVRQVGAALGVTADPALRHAIEEAHLAALEEQSYLAEQYVARYREGLAEVGYGAHLAAHQILCGIDLQAMARDGDRFLAETETVYRELLAWHLPKLAAIGAAEAQLSDAIRLEAAVEWDARLPGGERNRAVLERLSETGLEPYGEGRIEVTWGTYLGVAAGAVCRAPRVPEVVRLAVSTRSGRSAVASFLSAYGTALHQAYMAPELPVEQRRLGDESVPLASGALFEWLLRSRSFLRHSYDFSRETADEYLRLEALILLLEVRREIGRLRYEIDYHDRGARAAEYAELMGHATGFRHDPRAAVWSVDGEFGAARRIRAVQLGALHHTLLRDRFDEDWFRNPAAGEYMRGLFAHGRRHSAPELAVQLSSRPLGFASLLDLIGDLV